MCSRQKPESARIVIPTSGQAVDALGDELVGGVLDPVGVAVVGEAAGERSYDAESHLQLAQEERSAVGGDVAAVEAGDHLAPPEGLAGEPLAATLCLHGPSPLVWHNRNW
jgi:hypothetical protein